MKLNLEKFNSYKKIINSIIEKHSPYTETILLSFKRGYAYFQNDLVHGRIKIEKDENEPDLFINAYKFLLLTNSLKEAEVKEGVLVSGSDNFKLGNYEQLSYDIPDFDEYIPYKEYNDILKNKDLLLDLKQGFHYIAKDFGDTLNAVFVKDNTIMSSDRSKVYEKKLKDNYCNINLQENLLKLVFSLNEEDCLSFSISKGKEEHKKILLSINDECDIIINSSINLSAPPIDTDRFKASYNHDTYVVCDLVDFYNTVNFIFPFTEMDTNNRVYMSIKDGRVLLEVKEDSINIKKFVDILDTNIVDNDKEYLLCCGDIKVLLNHLEGDKIKIQLTNEKFIEEDSNCTILNFTTLENVNKHIVLPEME